MTSDVKDLPFAGEYIRPILEGKKTATVRYDDADGLRVGDEIRLTGNDGERFANAHVTRTATGNAIEARMLLEAFGAEYPTENIDDLMEGVNRHYEDRIGPATTVRVIVFEVDSTADPVVLVEEGEVTVF